PIPLAHISNSSDDSKEVSPSNSLEDVDDYYKMILEEYAKDCEYFDKEIDSTPQSVKETNEEVASQSGGKSNEIKYRAQ
ncbi:15987_t:CDS:2, partial [Funneliformis mosseae]